MKINFITTPTSGSQSMYRILTEYAKTLSLPLSMYRGADCKSYEGIKDNELTIVNFRDPRDMWCNQYYWLTQHPARTEKARQDRILRFERGIDASVLQSLKALKSDRSFSLVLDIYKNKDLPKNNVLFVSYAQLCLEFDSMVDNINQFLSANLTKENNDVLYNESPEGLSENPEWIGKKWQGCDISPGRFKQELKNDTLLKLDSELKLYLSIFEDVEIPELKYLYWI